MDINMNAEPLGQSTLSDIVWDSIFNYLKDSGEQLLDLKIENVCYRNNSDIGIISGRSDRSCHRYVVKRMKHSPADLQTLAPNQSQVEYEILSKLYPRFENIDNLNVPKPVAHIREYDILITEYVDGTILADELMYLHYMSNLRRFRQLNDYFRCCGAWLRHLHDITGISMSNELDCDYFTTHCDVRLAWLESNAVRHVPGHFRKSVMEFLEDQMSRSRGLDIPMTGRHSDFGPWNILCHHGQITVLDFVGFRLDPLPMSIISVLVYMDTQRRMFANSRRRVAELTRSFLEGFGPLPSIPQPVILLCEAFHRIINLGSAVRFKERNLIKKFERISCIRNHVDWFEQGPTRSRLWDA